MSATPATTFDLAPSIDAEEAAKRALAKHALACCVARVEGGTGPDRRATLTGALLQFPTLHDKYTAPALSIASMTLEENDACPVDLGATEDGEETATSTIVEGTLALDVWCADPVERKAFKSALRALFRASLGEAVANESGGAITLPMPDEALPVQFRGRMLRRISYEMTTPPHDVDDDVDGHASRWRATSVVAWQAEFVTASSVALILDFQQSPDVLEPGASSEQGENQ